jgi:hypothetical protein
VMLVVVREELWMVMKMKDLRLEDAFALHNSARPSARVWPKVFNARLIADPSPPSVIFSVPDRFSSSNVHRSESQTSPDLPLLPRSESFSAGGKPITAYTPPCIALRRLDKASYTIGRYQPFPGEQRMSGRMSGSE